jgi:hypothetical protein
VFSFTTELLYPQYPLDRRLGGPRVSLEVDKRKKKSLLLLGIKPIIQPIA